MFKILAISMISLAVSFACKKNPPDDGKPHPKILKCTDGIRISWDYSTLRRIAPLPGRPAGYYGYARMIETSDGILACIYESSAGNIEITTSPDKGNSWSQPGIVFSNRNNINMAVPDIIELSDHSILAACNPRPKAPYTDERRFGIRVRKSTDGGKSWGPDQLIYEADYTFENGCWEPAFVQLPDGEVQLFFSNEAVYTSSGEQNISFFRSKDFGDTWTSNPEIAGFRAGRRDGMPVPLVLADKGELLVSIEDNKTGEFKPTIYREQIINNWHDGTITADDPRRSYHPLSEPLPAGIYAGGPFIERLKTGEVLLSYQSNLNRSKLWDRSAMIVEIGDDRGTVFSRRTVPFLIPDAGWGLWNSLAVIDGNTPVAITSTNAFSDYSTEVWMIKGKVIPEVLIPQGTPEIDGHPGDSCWQGTRPYFVGHNGKTSLSASLCFDANCLFVAGSLTNADAAAEPGIAPDAEISFQLDTERKGYAETHTGIFNFQITAGGTLTIRQGENGVWNEEAAPGAVPLKVVETDHGCVFEMAIPHGYTGISPDPANSLGVNFTLRYRTASGLINEESIGSNKPGQPFTWCKVRF